MAVPLDYLKAGLDGKAIDFNQCTSSATVGI